MKNKRKKAVVFGGSGFLGSHVADELTDNGYEVLNFDTKPSSFLKEGQYELIGDMLDQNAVDEAVYGAACVYNFAGLADINEAIHKPYQTIKLNVLGNLNILEACRKHEIFRFVFASSLYIYNSQGSFYSISKQTSEKICEEYHKRYGLNYTILRYGSLYGRRADTRNTIHRFVQKAFCEKKISYPGSGEELREYIHVKDAARISVQILADSYANQHLLLTGNQSMRIKDVMKMIKEMFSNEVDIELLNKPQQGHYEVTPYSYKPNLGLRITANTFVDLGQGILDCIHELEEKTLKNGVLSELHPVKIEETVSSQQEVREI